MKSIPSLSRSNLGQALGVVTLLAGVVLMGCSAFRTAAICPARPSSIVLAALTSPSDIDISKQVGPTVSQEVAQRAASVCATLSTAVADAHPEGDLVLASTELKPTVKDAPNPTPWIAELQQKAEAWLHRRFLQPLGSSVAEPGSPVLTTIIAVGMQLRTADRHRSTIVLITDGFAVEKAPDGGFIDFERPNDPALKEHLQSFVPGLRALKGGCVMIVGAGAHTRLGLRHVDEVRDDIKNVLHAAGIKFVWTRSPQLPARC